MKIGSPADKAPAVPAASTGRTQSGDAAATAAPAKGAAEPSTQVEISTAATALLSGAKGSTPEFDADKVARVSAAIADGSFKVNHAAIADKLISNAQELLTKASH